MGDNETRGSSSTAAVSQNGGVYANDINVSNTTIFLVHLPQIDSSAQPAVVGSCPTLGKWKETKVLLKQVPKTTLWKSDPIDIPISEDVTYKYVLIVKGFFGQSMEYEGHNQSSNRRMTFRKFQFDVWQNNNKYKIDKEHLKANFKFVDHIYLTIDGIESLRDKIMDYQYIMKNHPEFTICATNFKFINQNLINSSKKEQRFFLCILLGHLQTHHYMAIYSLPESFQSANLLEDLASVDPDLILSDIRHLILGAIRILVQHNSLQGSTSWFKMFSLAPKLDTSYSFVDSAESYDFKNNNDQFCVALMEYVKPNIYELLNHLDVFHKVMKKLINITYNLESLIFLWNDIIGLERVDDHLCKMMKRKIIEFIKFDDPSRLKDHFNLFPNELKDIVAPEFRNKLMKLFNERNLKWKKNHIDCFQELLQNDLLQWSLEEYAR
ncbi:17521_t:CDS:2, partial [Gigaspora margarita]